MKRRAIITALIVWLCLLTACGSPVDKMMKAVEDGDYAKASEVYETEIAGNTETEDEATDRLWDEAENIYEQYNEGKIRYEEAVQKLNTIEKVNADGWNAVFMVRKRLDYLLPSKTRYAEGEKLLNDGKYIEAIEKLLLVYMDDTLFETVPGKLQKAVEALCTSFQQTIEDAKASGDWGSALKKLGSLEGEMLAAEEYYQELWDSADLLYSEEYIAEYCDALRNAGVMEQQSYFWNWMNDPALNEELTAAVEGWFTAESTRLYGENGDMKAVWAFAQQYAEYLDFFEDCITSLMNRKVDETIEKAKKAFNDSGNYDSAKTVLEQAIKEFPQDQSASYWRAEFEYALDYAAAESIEPMYIQAVLNNAEAKFKSGNGKNYEAAVKEIRSGLSSFPSDESLDEALTYYLSYGPQYLANFVIENRNCFTVDVNPDSDYKDMSGKKYTTVHSGKSSDSGNVDHYILYYLNAEYKTLSGYVYWPWVARTQGESTYCCIYGDGELLYKSPELDKLSIDPTAISVDVTGVRELKILIPPSGVFKNTNTWWSYEPKICLGDLMVQK